MARTLKQLLLLYPKCSKQLAETWGKIKLLKINTVVSERKITLMRPMAEEKINEFADTAKKNHPKWNM